MKFGLKGGREKINTQKHTWITKDREVYYKEWKE
jgi:hypothetical protein